MPESDAWIACPRCGSMPVPLTTETSGEHMSIKRVACPVCGHVFSDEEVRSALATILDGKRG
jgi:DNA-directed RNA polymerase subunit RPC12/RpoP